MATSNYCGTTVLSPEQGKRLLHDMGRETHVEATKRIHNASIQRIANMTPEERLLRAIFGE